MAQTRPFERESDVRLIQDLCAETWRRLGPYAPVHVGDVAWWMYQRPNRLADARVQLWLEDGACVAFAWNWLSKGDLDCVVHPDRPEYLDDVLAWADAPTVYTQESDSHKIERLEAHGYERVDGDVSNHMVLSLDEELQEPRVPDGYRLRTVGPPDLERRVEVHRAAFAPSRVVPESYARLQLEWPYRADLDHVIEMVQHLVARQHLRHRSIWLTPLADRGKELPVLQLNAVHRHIDLADVDGLFLAGERAGDQIARHHPAVVRGQHS